MQANYSWFLLSTNIEFDIFKKLLRKRYLEYIWSCALLTF